MASLGRERRTGIHSRVRRGVFLLTGLVFIPTVAADLQAAVITVNSTLDETPAVNNGLCSIREAIENANDNAATNPDCNAGMAGEDTIRLPPGTIVLNSFLTVQSEYLIIGDKTTITRPGGSVFSTAGQEGSLTLRALTVDGDGGICISNAGGNITYVLDRVTLVRCNLGVSIAAVGPASVRLFVVNSTIQATSGGGLGITLAGDVIEADIINSTITQAAGIGLTFAGSTVRMANTLLADNATNCASTPVMTGVNLSDDASCGSASANLKVVADAMLGPLADNGGPTMTHALLPGSPAIDMADDAICATDANGVDQRGRQRPADGDGDGVAICDIGAFEVGAIRSAPAMNRAGLAAAVILLTGVGMFFLRQRRRA
jgi:hypothetical protein